MGHRPLCFLGLMPLVLRALGISYLFLKGLKGLGSSENGPRPTGHVLNHPSNHITNGGTVASRGVGPGQAAPPR